MSPQLSVFLPTEDLKILLFLMLAFFFSGIVKGFLGMGLPASAMGFLTLVMEPTVAISLLIVPIVFTNFAQFFRSTYPLKIAKKFRYFAIAIILSIFFTSMFITSYPTELLTVSIGFAMVVFSLQSMFAINIKVKDSFFSHILFGCVAGILGGLSSIWSPIVGMYLISKNYSKDDFIGISGFLFFAGCLPLSLGLYISGILTVSSVLQSLIGLLFVLFGFRVGELIRNKVPQTLFKKILLSIFFVMGLRLIVVGFF